MSAWVLSYEIISERVQISVLLKLTDLYTGLHALIENPIYHKILQ